MGKSLFASGWLRYGMSCVSGKAVALVFTAWAASAEEPVTILAFGDSLTQGYGLAQQDGFVPQLDQWLAEQGADVALINAGVSGDTTAGGAARIEWSLTPEVDGVIVALGGNDLLRGLDPDQARANLTKIMDVATSRDLPVLLVGMEAPANYGPEYKTSFDAIYPDLAASYNAIYVESFFEGLGDGDFAELQTHFQPDGIHPNAGGVSLIVGALGPAVLELVGRAAP